MGPTSRGGDEGNVGPEERAIQIVGEIEGERGASDIRRKRRKAMVQSLSERRADERQGMLEDGCYAVTDVGDERRPVWIKKLTPWCPRLPTEIWERIIDWVSEEDWKWDRNTNHSDDLASCARVCRAWLHRCRFHLYLTPLLGGRCQHEPFFATIRHLAHVLPNRNIHITVLGACSVKAIRFQEPGYQLLPMLLLQHPSYSASVAHLCIKSRLSDGETPPTDSRCHPSFLMAFKRTFSSLTTLELRSLELSSMSFLARLIGYCSPLQSLHLCGISMSPKQRSFIASPPPRSPRLHSLVIQCCDRILPSLIHTLLRGSMLQSLHTLEIFFSYECGTDWNTVAPSIQDALCQIGVSLANLKLTVRNAHSVECTGKKSRIPSAEYYGPFRSPGFTMALLLGSNLVLQSLSVYCHSNEMLHQMVTSLPPNHTMRDLSLRGLVLSNPEDLIKFIDSTIDCLNSDILASITSITLKLAHNSVWLVRGSRMRRSKERMSLVEELTKRWTRNREKLKYRNGTLLLQVYEYGPIARFIPISEDDEFTDDEEFPDWQDPPQLRVPAAVETGVEYFLLDKCDRYLRKSHWEGARKKELMSKLPVAEKSEDKVGYSRPQILNDLSILLRRSRPRH